MQEYIFNMENTRFGESQNTMILLKNGEDLFLMLRNPLGEEISKIKVLHISKLKKLTNFFYRGFNIALNGKTLEEQIIPEDDLMECERKILISGENLEEKTTHAINVLKNNYKAQVSHNHYERTMVYLDTQNKELQNNNMIFRLTQEENVVKATIHMDNNLSGDEKHIIKFFFNDTALSEVIDFFEKALSLVPITREFKSCRTEYKCILDGEKFEISLDSVPIQNGMYNSLEIECDNFPGAKEHNSSKVDISAKLFANSLGLGDCPVVDVGTEAIHELMTGQSFFDSLSINNKRK